ELLRAPPPPEVFATRCEFARRAIDAVGRRDAESRVRAEMAQRRLDEELRRLEAVGPTVSAAALAELTRAQERAFVDAATLVAGPDRVVWAADVPRVESLAVARGIDPSRARALLEASGVSLRVVDARPWSGLASLPGSPSTLDAVGEALLRHPSQGAEVVRRGAVLEWLRGNGASAEVVERAREARLEAERGGSESLVAHLQAWALGRRELVLGGVWYRDPDELSRTIAAGSLSAEALSRAAAEGVLAAWLRAAGRVPAAGAAALIARGDPSGARRLAWALGEPLAVGSVTARDPASLARAALERPDVRDAARGLWASGELLAWLESLPPAYRDERWIDALRRGGAYAGDESPLWSGVYALARANTLALVDAQGEPVVLTGVPQLRVTAQVAAVWDDLKRAYRTGELGAWLDVVAPERPRVSLPRPPRDEDGELNELLWSLGHAGLVLEWGNDDLPVRAPSDLVRAYRGHWANFEAQLSRGYPLSWLERFHGGVALLSGGPDGAPVTLAEMLAGLRAEVGRLPAGWAGLKLALLCGLRALPLDPCAPGDDATVRGYTATAGGGGDVTAWEPLRAHVVQGAAMLWLGLDPAAPPARARALLGSAFGAWNPGVDQAEFTRRMLSGMARAFGAPVPTQVLRAELERATGVPPAPTAPVAPRKRARWGLRLGALLGLAVVAAVTLPDLQERLEDGPVTPPAATPGTEVWVSVRVTLEADRNGADLRLDLDGSPPELRAVIEPRDEPVEVGPCPTAWRCTRSLDTMRLVPNVPFRVRLYDDDPVLPEPLGARWLRWRGGDQRVTTRVRDVTLTMDITRVRVPEARPTERPAAAPAPAPAPSAPATTPTPSAGRARRRRSSSR
ncbi:MAG: hypothetical protein R3A52_30670, partial [Polyangiales bacterium]